MMIYNSVALDGELSGIAIAVHGSATERRFQQLPGDIRPGSYTHASCSSLRRPEDET
jgi:hypothetical protein